MALRVLSGQFSSLRVKDAISGKKSIAHFYRDCSIWPRLNPSVVLAPLPRPLQVTVSGRLSMGGNNGIQLTASLHRLNWIAGQPCQVKITIINNSKKNIKNLTLGIYRSTVIFKPKVPLETLPENRSTSADLDAWQTSATKTQVAESTLVVCERGIRGHASAKGWWAGVGPGKSMTFSHFVSIPVIHFYSDVIPSLTLSYSQMLCRFQEESCLKSCMFCV